MANTIRTRMLYTLIILFAVIDCNNFFFEFFQEYQNGDVVMYNYDNAPNYYFIKLFKILTIILIIHLKLTKLMIFDFMTTFTPGRF